MAAAQSLERFHDQLWRLNNLYDIIDQDGNIIRFTMNSAQEQLYRDMWYLNCILKARQLGCTTFIDLFILDTCLFEANTHAGIIAHHRDDAAVILRNKIEFPFSRLPDGLKDSLMPDTSSRVEKIYANGSSIRVSTSYRSGTLQILHVSELGKIAARFPDKAEEIKTGAFEAVGKGQMIFVESTAEGRGGEFYDLCKRSEADATAGKRLSPLDFKFHFFPWYENPAYSLSDSERAGVVITQEMRAYFSQLSVITGEIFSDGQQAWYVLKEARMGDKMKREHPSTPKEAFESAIKGTFYPTEMALARSEGRITKVPYDKSLPVATFWDLGRNDINAIWCMQAVGPQRRFIDYYENSGESLAHYAKVLIDKGYIYGEHYLPHDVVVTDISRGDNKSRQEVLEGLNVKPVRVVPRIPDIGEGIEMTRNVIGSCWFDEEKCGTGIKCLDNYRKEWDERTATYKDRPFHDKHSNGADAFRQFAQGYMAARPKRSRKRRGNAMVA